MRDERQTVPCFECFLEHGSPICSRFEEHFISPKLQPNNKRLESVESVESVEQTDDDAVRGLDKPSQMGLL